MSSNTSILTYNSGVYNLLLNYNAPSARVGTTDNILGTIYCFLSRVDNWDTELVPPDPLQTQAYLKNVYKTMFVAKKITTNDMSPVIRRVNWTANTIYDYYRDDVDMFEKDENGIPVKNFYVKNRFDQVFKCLWNNNGAASTVEPYFEPGTYNANQLFQGADNYKWKYIYSITSGNKLKFMDENWMPVPAGNTVPNPVSTPAGLGSIDVINVTNGGSGYDEANAVVTISIVGDGKSASANAVVTAGEITDILVANTGSNYTYANVSITSAIGSGATAVASISPIGGHGYNPISGLGASNIMITAQFNKDEGGNLPTDIDYRQIGLIVNPLAYFGVGVDTANAEVYKTTTDLVVSSGFGVYTPDEVVYQSESGLFNEAYFTAKVLSFDSVFNIVKLINIEGDFVAGGVLYSQTSGTTRVALQIQQPSFIKNSGYITYITNRPPVQRNPDGSEQFKLVLGY
jgi:hypothetical protein